MAKSKAVNTNAYITICVQLYLWNYMEHSCAAGGAPAIFIPFSYMGACAWLGFPSGVMTSLELCNFHFQVFTLRGAAINAKGCPSVPVWPEGGVHAVWPG